MLLFPVYGPILLVAGLLFVTVALPLGLLWRAIRASRKTDERLSRLADRMRERFGEVEPKRPPFGPPRIAFKVDGRKAMLEIPDPKRLRLRVEESPGVPLPVLIRSRNWSFWPVGGSLQRISMGDAIVDDRIDLYAGSTFAGFISDRLLDGMEGETSRSELADSLVVLKSLSGVKAFEFRFSPDDGVGADLRLKTEDLFYRVEELESLLHHLHELNTRFATYDRWEPKSEADRTDKKSKPDPSA